MNITNWDNGEILHLIMAKGHVTQKILLKMIYDKFGQKIPQSTFSCKIINNKLKLTELQEICNLLGYEIYLKRKD